MSENVKEVALSVFTRHEFEKLWLAGYRPLLPVTPQDFSIGGVMPAILYMMRWGYRRGVGKFATVFGEGPKKRASITGVANKLTEESRYFNGFDDETKKAILGDLLLAYCLENKEHKTGREEQIQRVYPTHYFSSWIDLPQPVVNLRYVPELFVSMLTQDTYGQYYESHNFSDNKLLQLLGEGVFIESDSDNYKSDKYDENKELGLDQLLTVRVAQTLGEAPIKLRGENPEIPKYQPVASKASEQFYTDFNIFLRAYDKSIPRQALIPMLESCFAVNLLNIFLSTFQILREWEQTGNTINLTEHTSYPLLVDCSLSQDKEIRRYSEDCVDELHRHLSRLPVIIMTFNIIDLLATLKGYKEKFDSQNMKAEELLKKAGELININSREGIRIDDWCDEKCNAFLEIKEFLTARDILSNKQIPAIWRLSESITIMMGEKKQFGQYRKFFDSCLMIDNPNGLAKKREVRLNGSNTKRRSIALTNTVLDFLAHRHQIKENKRLGKKHLSLNNFIDILREKYGFYIDTAPPGMTIPDEVLKRNRCYLERKLRDLGLFIGVNDAESMKRLRTRFKTNGDGGSE